MKKAIIHSANNSKAHKMLCLLITMIVLPVFLYAQYPEGNIVPNPSFEEYKVCPQTYTPRDGSHKLITFWEYPTNGTPDYFNRCSNSDLFGVPGNFAGQAEPFHGNGYVGIIAIGTDINYREYIQARLLEPMQSGEKYCVSFRVRLATASKFAVNQIGLYFSELDISKDRVKSQIESNIGVDPHVRNPVQRILDDKKNWVEVCGLYTATGSENYIVIGNFYLYSRTRVVEDPDALANELGKEYSYYYIDQVLVFPLKGNCEACGCIPHDLNAEFETMQRTISVITTGGQPPYKYQWSNGDTSRLIKNVATGTYTCVVTDINGCTTTKKIDFTAPESTLKVTHQSEFTGGDDGWIKLFPTGGKPPYTYNWTNDSTTQNITNLTEGEYIYTVTDKNGDQVTNKIIFKDKFKEELENIEEGGKITLKNIFFDYNKTTLKAQSYIELDKLYEFMQENDIKEVEIAGHTDSDGSDEHNMKLSDGRAKSVMDYLVSKGIEKERLTSHGYGETIPVASNSTDIGRAENRRVEFVIKRK